MYNRKFYKKYVILDCETRGCGLWGKVPQGTASMEIKSGKAWISMVIQGLMPKGDGDYVLYFVFDDGDGYKGAALGNVPVSDTGMAKVKFSFDPNDVLGTGYRAEDIKAVALMTPDGNNEMVSPLCGYFNDRVDWRKDFSPVITEDKTVTAAKLEPKDTVNTDAVQGNQEIVGSDVIADRSENADNRIFQNEVERIKKAAENTDSAEENSASEDMELIWECSEKIEPFSENMPVEWAKINIRQTSCLPLKNRNSVNDPRVLLSYKRHGHFILGRLTGDSHKVVLLGIPEEYRREDENDFNQAGFYYFKPEDNVETEDGVRGYWLLSME